MQRRIPSQSNTMYKALIIVALFGASMAFGLDAEQHMTLQDVCGSLPGKPDALSKLDDDTMSKLLTHLSTVCKIYHRDYLGMGQDDDLLAIGRRGLLDGLLGENSQLSTLLKAADALSKAKGVFDEVKKIAPDVHQHLQGGIQDVTNNLHDLIDKISQEFTGKTTPKPSY